MVSDDPKVTEPLTEPRDHALCQQLVVVVVAGADKGKRHVSTGARTVIGTHESADITLRDTTVSRFHCELVIVDGAPLVRDLGSRNRTILDGVAVLGAHLRHGSTLVLGHSELRVELPQGHAKIPLSERDRFGRMVGRSRAMRAAFALLEKAARTDTTTLLLGETGTGKDIAAESLHGESERRDAPFVAIDCGAIPPNLLESELFGHEKGAFTGADTAREGAFEAASGGSLFLDEIGELSLDLQPKLLRALEKREIRRVGSTKTVAVDVRLIVATNRNLQREVNAGRFRADLYYRIAVVEVELPPLRERLDDLPVLAETILASLALDEPARALLRSAKFRTELANHAWPGNVRELRNYLERCATFEAQLPFPESDRPDEAPFDAELPLREARDRWVRAFERRYLAELLRRHDNNVTVAARAAGIDRVYLHRLLSRARLR